MITGGAQRTDSKSEQHLIEFRGVTKVYGEGHASMQALRGIDLCIEEGEFVAIMGPSGSGKSTCMNILGCLDTPTAGTYLFRDVDVGQLTRNQRALLRRYYQGFGGLIGIVLALVASIGLAGIVKVPFVFNAGIVVIAFFFSAAVGVVFGYFPAQKAARLNPIDALRHE